MSVGNILTTLNKSINICLDILEETKIPLGKLIDKTTNPERKETPCESELSGQDREYYSNVEKQTPVCCKMVNLKLKTSEKQNEKQRGKNVEEPEDISWFFEGENKVLSKLLGTEDAINVTSDIDKSGRYKTNKSKNYPIIRSDEISKIHDPPGNAEKQKETKEDDYEDDEFGSCFDGIPHSQYYSTHVNNTKSDSSPTEVSYSQTRVEADEDFDSCFEDIPHSQESSNKFDNTNSYTKQIRVMNTEDEFDSCFDDLPKRYSSSSIKDTNIAYKLQEDCFGITASPLQNDEIFTNNSKITEDSSNKVMQFESKNDFEQKLAAVMKSNKLAEGEQNRKIHNSSRHFKTVESSVQNMNEILINDLQHESYKHTTSSNISKQIKPFDTIDASLHGIPSSKYINRAENGSKQLNSQVNKENLDSMLKNLKGNKIKKDNSSMSQSRHFRQMKDCKIFTDKETIMQREQLINDTQDCIGTISDKINKKNENVNFSQDSDPEFLKHDNNWNVENEEQVDTNTMEADLWTSLRFVASGLSHGAEDIMDMVVDAAILQQTIEVHEDINSSQLR